MTERELLTAMGARLGSAIEAVCDHLEHTGYIDAARELRRLYDDAYLCEDCADGDH